MFSAVIDVHRNILSAQCYVKFEIKETLVNNMQIVGTKNSLLISLYCDNAVQQEVKILTPDNFFIPTSIAVGNYVSALIENESFKITQKSHYAKYRKVIERHLETLESEISTDEKKYCKRFKVNDEEDVIDCLDECMIDDPKVRKISYPELPIQDNIEVGFRLQISSSEVIPKGSTNLSTYSTLHEYLKSEIHINEPYEVICTQCGSLISVCPIKFQNVQEYCSSFSDLSESWFCHKNVSPSSDLNDKSLYVSDAYIYLHSIQLENLSFDVSGTEYKCKTCNAILTSGTVPENNGKYLKCFFADAILFRKPDSSQSVSKVYLNKIALLFLLTLINQKEFPVCRLFLQSKVEGSEDSCLLIWISSAEVAQFKFQIPANTMPAEVNFSTQGVYKAQYHQGTLSSSLVKSWSKDFGVDFYKVSEGLMKTIKFLLTSSSECILGKKIEKDGFSNGCIPSNMAYFMNI